LWTFVTYKAMKVMSRNNLQLFDVPITDAKLLICRQSAFRSSNEVFA